MRLLIVFLTPLLLSLGCSNQTATSLPSGPVSVRPTNVPRQQNSNPSTDRASSDSPNKSTVPTGWVKVSMPEGESEIYMPGKAERNESGNNCAYEYISEQIAFSVRVMEKMNEAAIASLRNKNHKDLLNVGRNVVLKSEPGIKLQNEKDIKCNGQSGLELLIELPEGFRRVRIFIINYQLLLVAVSGNKDAVESKEASMFFESFKVSAR
jgi:hypothetical protein